MDKHFIFLDRLFAKHGHAIWQVGGCVRDSYLGIAPKDIDYATTATPDQQIMIYNDAKIRYFETGLDHGTLTIVLKGVPYEITTLRIDRETDGRHATVEFTTDIIEDLNRRDLTFNAMAKDVHGNIIDPFNGRDDLDNGIVRFVGNPEQRISEDYLRILRYFRFFNRFGKAEDRSSIDAIKMGQNGLKNISVERIWAEMSKIISYHEVDKVSDTLRVMKETGILSVIGIDDYSENGFLQARKGTDDPAMIVGFMIGNTRLVKKWKMANIERDKIKFVIDRVNHYDMVMAKRDAVNGCSKEWISSMLMSHDKHDDADQIMEWDVPVFPVGGNDLISIGMKPSAEMGKVLNDMRNRWIDSDYTLRKIDLMNK